MLRPIPHLSAPRLLGLGGLLLTVLVGSAGCRNACQQLCVRLADYAEDCGFSVSDEEIATCIEDQADAEERKVCRQNGDAERIREEWTCEDLTLYWNVGA